MIQILYNTPNKTLTIMKKIFTLIIALALVPAFAAAQTTIARVVEQFKNCLLYTSPSPRDRQKSRMPSSA